LEFFVKVSFAVEPGEKLMRRAAATFSLGFLIASGWTMAAYGDQALEIIQKKRSFSADEISIAAGDVVKFSNQDEFIHQVYVESLTFNFDTEESSPGNVIGIKFTVPGKFEVRCHIHPKMKLVVNVN